MSKRKQRIPKFRIGGGIGSGGFDPSQYFQPIQYVPESPFQIPLEVFQKAAAGIDQSYANLEKKRLMLMPDKEAIDKLKKEMVGYNSQVDDVIGQLDGKQAELLKKTLANPNYIFTREGRAEVNQINGFLDTDKINRLKNDYEEGTRRWQKSVDKGTSGSVYVDKGNILVQDVSNPGRVQMVDASQFYAMRPEVQQRFKPLTIDSVHQHHSSSTKFGHQKYYNIGDQYDMNDVLKEIDGGFSDAGYRERAAAYETFAALQIDPKKPLLEQIRVRTKDNRQALQQAVRLIKNSLSQKSKDAILSDMIAKGKNPGDFDGYLANWLGFEEGKREIDVKEQERGLSLLPGGAGGGDEEEGAPGDWKIELVRGLGYTGDWDDLVVTTSNEDRNGSPVDGGPVKLNQEKVKFFPGTNLEKHNLEDLQNVNVKTPYRNKVYVNGSAVDFSRVTNARDENLIQGIVAVPKTLPSGEKVTEYFVSKLITVSGDTGDMEKLTINAPDKEGKISRKNLFSFGVDNASDEGKTVGVERKIVDDAYLENLNLPKDAGAFGTGNEVYYVPVLEPLTQSRVTQNSHEKSKADAVGEEAGFNRAKADAGTKALDGIRSLKRPATGR